MSIENSSTDNQKISIFKRIYRKIVFHLLLDTLIIPTLSFCTVSLKPVLLIALKPVVALITFLSALAVGFVGFMGGSSANEIVDLASNEVVEGSESNILEIILDFFF